MILLMLRAILSFHCTMKPFEIQSIFICFWSKYNNEIRTFLPFHSTCLSGKSTSIGIVDAGHRIMHKIPASLIYQNQLNYCAITYIRWNIYWFWFGFFFYFRVRDVWFLKIKTVFRRIFVHLIVYLLEKWVLSLRSDFTCTSTYKLYVHICLNN